MEFKTDHLHPIVDAYVPRSIFKASEGKYVVKFLYQLLPNPRKNTDSHVAQYIHAYQLRQQFEDGNYRLLVEAEVQSFTYNCGARAVAEIWTACDQLVPFFMEFLEAQLRHDNFIGLLLCSDRYGPTGQTYRHLKDFPGWTWHVYWNPNMGHNIVLGHKSLNGDLPGLRYVER